MHVANAAEYAALAVPDFVKVAWAIRVSPRADQASHVELEVRVDATDEAAWRKFRRYFRLIGPASRFIRRALFRSLVREFGRSAERVNSRPGPGTTTCQTPPAR